MTLLVAIILGAVTGLLISMKQLFDPIPDDQLFDDEVFWAVADGDSAGYQQLPADNSRRGSRRRSRAHRGSNAQDHEVAIKAISVSWSGATVPWSPGICAVWNFLTKSCLV